MFKNLAVAGPLAAMFVLALLGTDAYAGGAGQDGMPTQAVLHPWFPGWYPYYPVVVWPINGPFDVTRPLGSAPGQPQLPPVPPVPAIPPVPSYQPSYQPPHAADPLPYPVRSFQR